MQQQKCNAVGFALDAIIHDRARTEPPETVLCSAVNVRAHDIDILSKVSICRTFVYLLTTTDDSREYDKQLTIIKRRATSTDEPPGPIKTSRVLIWIQLSGVIKELILPRM